MSDRHASLYLASRLGAAILNLVSIAVFTRLATPDVYGGYLVGFATSFIVFASGFQWLLHAHFGIYTPVNAPRLAGALVICMGVVAMAGCGVLLATVVVGAVPPDTAIGLGVLSLGMVAHVGAVELARARLMARHVAAAGLLRGLLMLGMGSATLALTQSAPALLVAIGMAQLLAMLPMASGLRRGGVTLPRRSEVSRLLRYGWPLIGALAVTALALNLDRLVLERLHGAHALGAYGSASDIVRQSFVVMGEAIAAAYVSQAKAADTLAHRKQELGRAFTTLWTIVLLGVCGWLLLGPGLLGVLLPADFLAESTAVLPWIVLGTAALALRAYYFGQAIYFAGSAKREVWASSIMLGGVTFGAALLIAPFGAQGAAMAFALGQLAGLVSFIIADWRSGTMPVDKARATGAALCCLLAWGLGNVLLETGGWWLALVAVIMPAIVLGWRWDLFGAAHWLGSMRRQ